MRLPVLVPAKCRRSTFMNERASELLKMSKQRRRKATRAEKAKGSTAKAVSAIKDKEFKASLALKSIFYTTGRRLQRQILAEGCLILSYLTSYNLILQSYFILVRHHLLFI